MSCHAMSRMHVLNVWQQLVQGMHTDVAEVGLLLRRKRERVEELDFKTCLSTAGQVGTWAKATQCILRNTATVPLRTLETLFHKFNGTAYFI